MCLPTKRLQNWLVFTPLTCKQLGRKQIRLLFGEIWIEG
jgi:hypothetical protein